jgi:hypothetical protein
MVWRFALQRLVAPIAVAAIVTFLVVVGVAQEPSAAPIQKLDDPTRARALAALAGLIILGFAMVLLTWLGARVVQRYRQSTSYFRPTRRPGEHDWARKPLIPDEPDSTDLPPTDS